MTRTLRPRDELRKRTELRQPVRRALGIEKPDHVFWSVLGGGELALLNCSANTATLPLDGGQTLKLGTFSIVLRDAQ
jgi:hypothetical protein